MTTPATERGSSKNYSTDVVVDPREAEAIRQSLYRTDKAAMGQILPTFCAQLSSADLEHFREQGYLAMNGLLTTDEVEDCKTALSDLAQRRIAWDTRVWSQQEPYFAQGGQDARADDPELRLRKLAFFVQLEPRLRHVSDHPRLRAVIDQLIRPGARMIQDMALLKPPFRGSEKPWHQDAAYFDWTPLGGVVGTWIALDEATLDNGCMQVIPGSHLDGPAPHFHVRDCQLADQRVQVRRAVTIPLQPGGILFFSGLLHHGTPPNMTAARRRALQFHYAAAECRHMTIEQHGELFSSGGAYAGCRDWDLAAGTSRAVLTP
ncbi:MAG TPA: phytanoyl-CoA dioxygenase family protein [Chloroflexota bacterium]|nr:phytanoyl-CoA dioxygenase family protein [Chloroflexota bacterium]